MSHFRDLLKAEIISAIFSRFFLSHEKSGRGIFFVTSLWLFYTISKKILKGALFVACIPINTKRQKTKRFLEKLFPYIQKQNGVYSLIYIPHESGNYYQLSVRLNRWRNTDQVHIILGIGDTYFRIFHFFQGNITEYNLVTLYPLAQQLPSNPFERENLEKTFRFFTEQIW